MESFWASALLKKVPLFLGMEEQEIESILPCLEPVGKSYKKNQWIFLPGDSVPSVGIVVKGRVSIVQEDYLGNRHILTEAREGELFAEAFSCAGVPLPFGVESVGESKILFLKYQKVVTCCSSACWFHTKMIENMMRILAGKNIFLTGKMEHVTKRTTKEKLLSYLWEQSKRNDSLEFEIPFNRQQLADYLCVDRSAMSLELSKLKQQGYLDFHKNQFVLNRM